MCVPRTVWQTLAEVHDERGDFAATLHSADTGAPLPAPPAPMHLATANSLMTLPVPHRL